MKGLAAILRSRLGGLFANLRLSVVLLYAPLALLAIFWANGIQLRDSIMLYDATVENGPLIGLVLGSFTGFVLALAIAWCASRFTWARTLEDEFAGTLGPLKRGDVFWLALWSALGEELLFRGAMQSAWGLPVSCLIFAFCHFPLRRSLWPWTIMALAAGLILGGLFALLGTLWAPLAAHFVINVQGLERLRRRRQRPDAHGSDGGASATTGAGARDGRYSHFGADPDREY